MGSIPKLSIVKGGSFTLPEVRFLHRLFEENAATHPDSTAIVFDGKSILT